MIALNTDSEILPIPLLIFTGMSTVQNWAFEALWLQTYRTSKTNFENVCEDRLTSINLVYFGSLHSERTRGYIYTDLPPNRAQPWIVGFC